MPNFHDTWPPEPGHVTFNTQEYSMLRGRYTTPEVHQVARSIGEMLAYTSTPDTDARTIIDQLTETVPAGSPIGEKLRIFRNSANRSFWDTKKVIPTAALAGNTEGATV